MRILVVGAGAVGGYFGGRLQEKGVDVTFLVREGRKKQLDQTGLVIDSVHGKVTLTPKTILSGEEADAFDLILLSTKAYHLQGAFDSFRQYVNEKTAILPLLNGISHIEQLAAEFGQERIIGGLCFIETTLDQEGRIIQTSPRHDIVFGELSGEKTDRILKIEDAFSGTKSVYRLSDNINQDLWNKYLFISTMSGITTLMRAPIGPIREMPSGRATIEKLSQEIISVMNKMGAPLPEDIAALQLNQIDSLGYSMKSSMQRDMEKQLSVEADHLHGYVLTIARKEQIPVPVLEAVYANLKVYELQLQKDQ
ncbi:MULTISPECIES: ketopantoate reductase family protein [Neobacillus]|uniref:2-dehydropantoate 2-reductase n=1 Tax=Neobacillus rhizophilus TaxID=2833579 RepID=A0A942YW52_9BACI|nr:MULTISPECIES: ketopantoate reductase family protein [Neobacillus]MBS4213675.1 ketopantoate reductase family protein [Neobacillus rhizophilus]MBU8917919.1 ketopantoate reductase family protein [Bacillus sp. FJAT-29953]